MKCYLCLQELEGLPIYHGKGKKYPESLLFCNNSDCPRFGLLTVIYTNEETKDGTDTGVHEESVQVSE